MAVCIFSPKLNAYYDSELSQEEHIRLEQHIRGCPYCSRDLEQLQRVSAFINSASIPNIPDGMVNRLHQSVHALREKAVLRMVRMLSSAAILLLVVSSILLLRMGPNEQSASAFNQAWEKTAVTLQFDISSAEAPEFQFAQWLVADLSAENGNE